MYMIVWYVPRFSRIYTRYYFGLNNRFIGYENLQGHVIIYIAKYSNKLKRFITFE